MGHPPRAGVKCRAHVDASTAVRRGVGRCGGQSPAVPPGAYHQPAAQGRGEPGSSRAGRDGARGRLSSGAARVARHARFACLALAELGRRIRGRDGRLACRPRHGGHGTRAARVSAGDPGRECEWRTSAGSHADGGRVPVDRLLLPAAVRHPDREQAARLVGAAELPHDGRRHHALADAGAGPGRGGRAPGRRGGVVGPTRRGDPQHRPRGGCLGRYCRPDPHVSRGRALPDLRLGRRGRAIAASVVDGGCGSPAGTRPRRAAPLRPDRRGPRSGTAHHPRGLAGARAQSRRPVPDGCAADRARFRQRRFLEALAYYAALAIERTRLVAEAERAEALREADRLKDSVLASVSHDLRTPLTTIKALAQEGALRGETNALAIEEQADRLGRLVANLLDLSRLKGGALPVNLELNTAEDLVGAAIRQMAGLLQDRTVDTRVDFTEPALMGRFDFVQSLRILTNLLGNALQYTPASSPIELSVQREGALLVFAVADRGPGIPVAERDRIFEPFYRPPGGPADVGGSGFGLAIARRLAELQGGTLEYAARPGGGSIFALRLPADGALPPAPL